MLALLGFIPMILGAIPGIGSVVTYVTGKLYDSKVAITTAQIGGDRDVAVAMVAAQAKTQTSFYDAISHSRMLAFLVAGFALPYMVWEWKVVVFDIVLQNYFGWGDTDPIRGMAADWAGIIIPSLFGAGTIAAIGGMYFNRNKSVNDR